MKQRLMVLAGLAAASGAVLAAFTGPYAAANWTALPQSFGCGSAVVDTSGMPNTLVLQTITGCANIGATYQLTNPIPTTGTISFNWSYTSAGAYSGNYALGGANTQLASGVGPASGTVTVPVTAGQTFNFSLAGGTNASLTITNFNFTAPVQAPTMGEWAKLGMAGVLAVAAVAAIRRRSRSLPQ